MHTYKKLIYNFFTYIKNTYINFPNMLETHIKNTYITFLHMLKTHILIFYICMSGYTYIKNTYINFLHMYVWVHIYKKHIY